MTTMTQIFTVDYPHNWRGEAYKQITGTNEITYGVNLFDQDGRLMAMSWGATEANEDRLRASLDRHYDYWAATTVMPS